MRDLYWKLRVLAWRLWLPLVLLATLNACAAHRAERATRTALDVASHAVVEADATFAPIYRARAAEALDASTTLDEYRERVRRLDAVETALRASRASLVAAQSGVDAGANPSLGCLGVSVVALFHALREAGVDPPPTLNQALDLLTIFSTCEAPQ